MAIKQQFLVSFMVDARGGAMRGCRHSGVRVIIPPRKAAMPMRITCRYLKKDKLVHAPPLMEGEALASRILEMGPSGAKFLGPVIIEVPHFASLRGKEREIVILRSDNGETWREHTLEATEEAVQEVLNESFDGEELKQLEDLNTNRITRILTTDFPQYFAIVTRIRQEVHAIGPEGGMVSSTVVPQVQAVFPQGALTKKIKVGLQAQPINTELVAKLLGNRVAVSPIVTVEPRRRKFHKPITLTIPVPQAASKGMINQYSGEAPTLRLLCSITGGTTRAQWEDVTGSTPLTFVNDCVSFTTTVSARFWLMDCTNIPEATKMATELYREAIHVPFMAKFVVFSKRHAAEEARVRVFCMTDDKEDKTLETQEHFVEVAKSRDVEVLEGKTQYLEFAGNLIPVTKSGDQLAFNFYAFRENRLPFTVRVKDPNAESVGRVAFMRQPKVGRGEAPQSPICNLNLSLPDNIQPEPAPSEPDLLALEKKYAFLSISKADTIHKADLRLSDISNMLAGDWVALAKELDVSDSDINIIKSQYPDNIPQQAIVMLRLWMEIAGNKATGNTLEKALRSIHREDIVDECICNLEEVTDDREKAVAKEHLDQSDLPSTFDTKDVIKESVVTHELDESHKILQERRREKDFSPTYETEERKYAAEEKIVKDYEERGMERDILNQKSFPPKESPSLIEKKTPKDERISTKDDQLPPKKEGMTDNEPGKSLIDDKKLPKNDRKSPKDDKTPAKDKKITPKDDKTPPKDEKITPKDDKTLPKYEKITPKDDKIPPKDDKTPPKDDKTSPKDDKKWPKGEKIYIKEEKKSKTATVVSEMKTEETRKTKGGEVEIEKKEESVKEIKEKTIEQLAEESHDRKLVEKKKEELESLEEKKSEEKKVFIMKTKEGEKKNEPNRTTTKTHQTTTADDGTITEVITVQTRTSSIAEVPRQPKEEFLQKLGEELGKLDEKLEQKFKEKKEKIPVHNGEDEGVSEMEIVPELRSTTVHTTSQVVVESVPAESPQDIAKLVCVEKISESEQVEEIPSPQSPVAKLPAELQEIPTTESAKDVCRAISPHENIISESPTDSMVEIKEVPLQTTIETPYELSGTQSRIEPISSYSEIDQEEYLVKIPKNFGPQVSITKEEIISSIPEPYDIKQDIVETLVQRTSEIPVAPEEIGREKTLETNESLIHLETLEPEVTHGIAILPDVNINLPDKSLHLTSKVPPEKLPEQEHLQTREEQAETMPTNIISSSINESSPELEYIKTLKEDSEPIHEDISHSEMFSPDQYPKSEYPLRYEGHPENISEQISHSEGKFIPSEISETRTEIVKEVLTPKVEDKEVDSTISIIQDQSSLVLTEPSTKEEITPLAPTIQPTVEFEDKVFIQSYSDDLRHQIDPFFEQNDHVMTSESLIEPKHTDSLLHDTVESKPLVALEDMESESAESCEQLITEQKVMKEQDLEVTAEDSKLVPQPSAQMDAPALKDELTQPSAHESQMVPGVSTPSDVKLQAPAYELTTSETQPFKMEIGEVVESAPTDSSKVKANPKGPIKPVDLSGLESLLATEEEGAKVTPVAKASNTIDGTPLTHLDLTSSLASIESESKIEELKLPPKIKKITPKVPPPPPPRMAPLLPASFTGQVEKVSHSKTSEEGHGSSDEADEPLTLMRDSPRWEEEEILAEESEMQRPIKAEIKLLVKTSQVGKELIEIRSIREFVDPNSNAIKGDSNTSEVVRLDNNQPDTFSNVTSEEKVSPLPSLPLSGRTPSPRFVRPSDTYSFNEANCDEFDLMAQVRDILEPADEKNSLPQL